MYSYIRQGLGPPPASMNRNQVRRPKPNAGSSWAGMWGKFTHSPSICWFRAV